LDEDIREEIRRLTYRPTPEEPEVAGAKGNGVLDSPYISPYDKVIPRVSGFAIALASLFIDVGVNLATGNGFSTVVFENIGLFYLLCFVVYPALYAGISKWKFGYYRGFGAFTKAVYKVALISLIPLILFLGFFFVLTLLVGCPSC
jgi:hypothetical protein